MKKKVIISVAAIAVLVAVTAVLIALNRSESNPKDGSAQNRSGAEDSADSAPFPVEYPDRVCGIPATGFEVNGRMVEVRYGEANYVRKALGGSDAGEDAAKYGETGELTVNGMTVTLKGDGGLVYLALWSYNNYDYTVCAGEGVSAEEMAEYVEATG